MGRMKTFLKYIIWIVLFWIFSDILINAGLNTTYKNMNNRGELPSGIEVVQMQSTKVNGRIKLKVSNQEFSGKFLKIDLYSENNRLIATKYIEIGNISENQIKSFETYFKITDVKAYEISVVDEKGEDTEGFMDNALSAMTVFMLAIKILII